LTIHNVVQAQSVFDERKLQAALFQSWLLGQKLGMKQLQKSMLPKNSFNFKYKSSFEFRERLA